MKKLRLGNVAGLLVIVAAIPLVALFIRFLIIFPKMESSGPDPTRSMSSVITFLFHYGIFFSLSVILAIVTLFCRKADSKRLVMSLGSLPLLLTVGTPIGLILLKSLEPGREAQRHTLAIELRSPAELAGCRYDLLRSFGIEGGPLENPEEIGDAYVYRLSTTIYKFRTGGRKLTVHTSWGTSEFTFEAIPEMPHPIPSFTDWTGPNSVEPKQIGGPDLRIRYRVTKD